MYEFIIKIALNWYFVAEAHVRPMVLNLSATLSSSDKEKLWLVLKADFMSSDESDSGINDTARSRPDLEGWSDSQCITLATEAVDDWKPQS